ncbi:MAG: hypothetical protein HFE78_03830 [Clostridiales bacterium]|nr:hypothetical protein [Clostridiales bacterium]
MREINIINPAAGKGDAARFASLDGERVSYHTKFATDAECFVLEECKKDADVHFFVYGGDGTVNEVVNGIMAAGAQDSVLLSIIPVGTGNDLIRSFSGPKTIRRLDVIQYNDRYAINMLNIGFDCAAALRANRLKEKQWMTGSFSYIAGVIGSLFSDYGQELAITVEDQNGVIHSFSGEFLLCAIANGRFYGGGFEAAPAARYDDGLFDFVLVKKVSKPYFLKMVSSYKKGKHIDTATDQAAPRFQQVLEHLRGRRITINGLDAVCADGEVHKTASLSASILPGQIQFMI